VSCAVSRRRITELITAKRADPGDDLLSARALVRGDVSEDGSGEGLTDTEARPLAFQIIMGGFGTTVNLIGNGTLALLTYPSTSPEVRPLTVVTGTASRYSSLP
jgi:cytochrome P450